MKLIPIVTLLVCITLSLQAGDQNSVTKKSPISEKKKNAYPGVGWKPKNGDPKPHENLDAYPGVEWSPKK